MLLITHPCDPIGLECQDWSEDVIGMRRGSKHFPALSPCLCICMMYCHKFRTEECRKWTLLAFIVKFIRRCVRQMHELRLHKHLKTKEVEMLVSATINIISVDEKVGNFCLENLGEEEAKSFGCTSSAVWLRRAGCLRRMQEVGLQFR